MRLNVLNSKHAFIMVLKGQMLGMKIKNKPTVPLWEVAGPLRNLNW